MSSPIKNSEKYLQGRLAETRGRPDLHPRTIQVYHELINIIQSDPENYLNRAGDMFATLQAEQCDYEYAFQLLYEKLENSERARAHGEVLKALESATGYSDIWMKKSEAVSSVNDMMNVGIEKRNAVIHFFASLVNYMRSVDTLKLKFKNQVLENWIALQELDPEISFEKLKTHKPYCYLTYYDNARYALLEKGFREVLP